jgi:hypothetical protein
VTDSEGNTLGSASGPESADPDADAGEIALAEVTEQIACRLHAGEPVDFDEYARRYPKLAGPLGRLLPTLFDLVALGRKVGDEPANSEIGS